MQGKISVVINTLNEEENLKRCLASLKWADEILICDMYSDDNSAVVAKKFGAKIIFHKRLSYVEPARNFAISKAKNDWVLVLDPDEEVPESLAKKLQEIVKTDGVATFIEIPRKNIIFNKWVKASGWWPDYNIRFFKKDKVKWSNQIHIPPKTEGQGIQLPLEERFTITHYHYQSISQFLVRMDRYTNIQAKHLQEENVEFHWADLIQKPLSEFLGRYFANKGFQDGLHGLSLALLQAFSFLVVYLKLWELQGFKEQNLKFVEIQEETKKAGKEINYWFKYGNLSKNPLKNFLQRAKNKVS
jgi:(heptosyl)LPS beta-1,4-glucosyltransferase